MSKRQKRRQKIAQNPTNVQFDELRRLLEDYGFVLKRTRGSHHSFVGFVSGEKVTLVIPYRKPLNPVYVNRTLELIEQIEASEGNEEEKSPDDE